MSKGVFALVVSVALSGCGLHTTGGPTWVGHRKVTSQWSAAVGTHAQRKSTAVVGFRANAHYSDGFELRSGMIHGGYDIILFPGWLALEPGFDFGAGQPAIHAYDGVGAYGGGALVTRLRLTPGEREPGFNIVIPIIELTAGGHAGLWMPPESATTSRTVFDRGFEFGLRFAVGSDLVSPDQGAIWRGGAEPKSPNPPGSGASP